MSILFINIKFALPKDYIFGFLLIKTNIYLLHF